MKIWQGYGSEHSARLVMIGKFKEVSSAKEAMKAISSIIDQAEKDQRNGNLHENSNKYSPEMLDTIIKNEVSGISPRNLIEFCQDVNIEQDGDSITFKTNETDVSAFITILILKGAKIEIYSSHDYSE